MKNWGARWLRYINAKNHNFRPGSPLPSPQFGHLDLFGIPIAFGLTIWEVFADATWPGKVLLVFQLVIGLGITASLVPKRNQRGPVYFVIFLAGGILFGSLCTYLIQVQFVAGIVAFGTVLSFAGACCAYSSALALLPFFVVERFFHERIDRFVEHKVSRLKGRGRNDD